MEIYLLRSRPANDFEADLFWSHSAGWGAIGAATIFDVEESKTFELPLDAERDTLHWVCFTPTMTVEYGA